jgi:hypothetical protein
LDIISNFKPVAKESWIRVAEKYQEFSKEVIVRDATDVKRHFIEKMCNKNRKPTGSSGQDDNIRKAQAVYNSILVKENAKSIGNQSDGDSNDSSTSDNSDDYSDQDIEEKLSSQIISTSSKLNQTIIDIDINDDHKPKKIKKEHGSQDNKSKNAKISPRMNASIAMKNMAESISSKGSSLTEIYMLHLKEDCKRKEELEIKEEKRRSEEKKEAEERKRQDEEREERRQQRHEMMMMMMVKAMSTTSSHSLDNFYSKEKE